MDGPSERFGEVPKLETHPVQRYPIRCPRTDLPEYPAEGRSGVVQGLEGGGPGLVEHRGERRVPRQVGADDDGVDETPDERLGFGQRPPGGRDADQDVVLSAVAGDEHLEGGEQRHEQRRPVRGRQRLQPAGQFDRDPRRDRFDVARRPPIRRQVQVGGEVGQTSAPVCEVGGDPFLVDLAPFPPSEIGEADRRGREVGGCPALDGGVVVGDEFVHEDPLRPPVEDDVVEGHRQEMVGGSPTDQQRPERHLPGEVEGSTEVTFGFAAGRRRRVGIAGHVDHRQVHRTRRLHPLDRFRSVGGEGGPQHRMASHDGAEGRCEGVDVELTADRQGEGTVGGRPVPGELGQDPQALLHVGEGSGRLVDVDDARPGPAKALGEDPFDPVAAVIHRRRASPR